MAETGKKKTEGTRTAEPAPENRKIRYTRRVLRESLVELMKSRSILHITIKDICGNADISRSTFYTHYRDQFDLLRQIEDETLSWFDSLLASYAERRSKKDAVQMVEKLLEYVAGNINSIQVLLSENGDIGFQKKLFSFFAKNERVMKYLDGTQADEREKEYVSVFVVNGAIGLLQHWMKNGMDVPIPALARMLIKLAWQNR